MTAKEESDRYMTLYQGERLTQMLPHRFERTGFTVKTLGVSCSLCKRPLEAEHISGVCDRSHPNRIEFELVGLCVHCDALIPSRFRVYDDRTVSWTDAEGYWQTCMIKESIVSWEGISHAVQALVKRIRGVFAGS
jgi:hypothetical protein